MASLAPFFERVRPVLDKFLKESTRDNLKHLENELQVFNWLELKIVHVHVLFPLVLKLEELHGKDQELRTGLLNCIRLVVSNVFLKDKKSLCTILSITLKQIRDFESAKMLPNLSEEIKMAATLCISDALAHTTSDVLEEFYTKDFSRLQGQILLMLVEIIELEKYRTLRLNAIECLMVVFYVQDNTAEDVVLRSQVADTLFIYLPKVLSVLFKTATSDDKLGETLKSISVKALGHILTIMCEQTNDPAGKSSYDIKDFQRLVNHSKDTQEAEHDILLSGPKLKKEKLQEHLTRMQDNGRSSQWFRETSLRLNGIFRQMSILCAHPSSKIRLEHARMCSLILENCIENLKVNFIILLECLIALSEDEDESIRALCKKTLKNVSQQTKNISIFDESADMLFEEHSAKLLQTLHRKNEYELYAELLFFKGFLRNLGSKKLYSLFSLSSFGESFCMALITTADLEASHKLLNEEFSLRELSQVDYNECAKLQWRNFKHLESSRCIDTMKDICAILGATSQVNVLIFDFLMDIFRNEQNRMNETLLVMIWMFTVDVTTQPKEKKVQYGFIETILENIFDENHWHLALTPDATTRLKVNKPSYWFCDESGVEVRKQDYDSDDEGMDDTIERVGIADVQQNILHTCIVLDALSHCATTLGVHFKKYTFYSLHKVLLKVANSKTMIYQAALYCLISMQESLAFKSLSEFIEAHTDYLSYHLNITLRRTPESSAAVDILSVVLQLSSRNTVPHLESIFQTIHDECSKAHQEQHICAYLRVFNAFLINVNRWHMDCINEVESTINNCSVDVESKTLDSDDVLTNWLQILENLEKPFEEEMEFENIENEKYQNNVEHNDADNHHNSVKVHNKENDSGNENCDTELPRHFIIIKGITEQTLKFISSSSQAHQIQSLECLIVGIPLLEDYENELLPLVHKIWQPLLEKFRQKDPLVLNRCFTLLNVLSTYAKEFILKRSLDDVIPYLRHFLKDSSAQSAIEHTLAQTQIYKLQSKLLQEFSNLIVTMKIDGKHLNDIAEVISFYLSLKQPKELQIYASKFFLDLKEFNGPLVYLIAMKKCHLSEYKDNVSIIMSEYGVR